MDLLHTEKELKDICKLSEKIREVEPIAKRTNCPHLYHILNMDKIKVQNELNKYNHLVGKNMASLRSISRDEPKNGHIESISHFYYGGPVVIFRYDDRGFDRLPLKDIELC